MADAVGPQAVQLDGPIPGSRNQGVFIDVSRQRRDDVKSRCETAQLDVGSVVPEGSYEGSVPGGVPLSHLSQVAVVPPGVAVQRLVAFIAWKHVSPEVGREKQSSARRFDGVGRLRALRG